MMVVSQDMQILKSGILLIRRQSRSEGRLSRLSKRRKINQWG